MIEQSAPALVERHAAMMATTVSAHLNVPPERAEAARAALDRVFAFFAAVAERLTRFDPQSELSQLNASAGRWFPASPLLVAAVRAALEAARRSDGLCDPTLLPLLEAAGYDRDFAAIARREIGPGDLSDHPTGLWRAIRVRDDAVRLPPGARLDLGGLAKGWAADVALEDLLADFPDALVSVGGDIRLRGSQPGSPGWVVGIEDPRIDALAGHDRATLALKAGGVATSGATRRWWRRGGQRMHHIFDPRTRRPARLWSDADDDAAPDAARLIAAATALAPTALRAEVAAKLALLRGYPAALAAVEQPELPADDDVALILVLGSGDVAVSLHLAEWLRHPEREGLLWSSPR